MKKFIVIFILVFGVWSNAYINNGGGSSGGSGLTSLNSQTGATQSFANDTNVTITSSNNTHTLGWASTLSIARGGTGNSSFTAGSIPYSNGSILTQSNSDLFWDGTNNRLGIGISSPQARLHWGSSSLLNTTSGTVGNDALILGYISSTANVGSNAVVLGGNSAQKNTASGSNSTATGAVTTASGQQSFSGGNNSIASGSQSFAFGFGSTGTNSPRANGTASIAMGSDVAATGASAFAINHGTIANGTSANALGESTKAQGYAQTSLGLFNIVNGQTGGGINSPVAGGDLLIVGNGVDTTHRDNAFSVTNEGVARISISTHPPTSIQTLVDGFSIDPSRTYTPINSASAISSDTSTIILTTDSGSQGGVNVEPGQIIILQNKNASDAITLKNGGNAKLPGATDLVLGSNDSVTLIFDGTNWVTISSSNN